MMHVRSNASSTSDSRRRAVLETIRRTGPISRADLARRTGLSRQAASTVLERLLEEGLVQEVAPAKAGRRRGARQLAINAERGLTIGIEVRPDRMVGALVDFAGVMRTQAARFLTWATPDNVIAAAQDVIARLRASPAAAQAEIIGVGIVMPGPFKVSSFQVGPTELPCWRGVDPEALFAAALQMPVQVENDAMATALGERLHGVAGHLHHFAYLHFGVGIGLGLVANGEPYTGIHGNAGKIGHVIVEPGGKPCSCGEAGCLERYVSLQALREHLMEAGEEVLDDECLSPVAQPLVADWCSDAAMYLRPVIMMLENLFDPEAIIVGGSMPSLLIDEILAGLDPLPYSIAKRSRRSMPRVMRGASGPLAPVLGAAALPLYRSLLTERQAVVRPPATRLSALDTQICPGRLPRIARP